MLMGRFTILMALPLGCLPIHVLAQASPSSPPLHCISEHGAWCVLDGAGEQPLATASGVSAFKLSDPSQSDASLIVISPVGCDRVRADQLAFLSFEHGLKRYGQEWEGISVRLRNDGTCDLQILLPQFSSNPFEWAFSSGLQLIRACKSDVCEGAPLGVLKPAFELRYRSAALPIARPEVIREEERFPMTTSLDPAESPADSVAFCDVVGQPTLFKKRRISFVARLESDGIHAVVLVDPSCKGGMTIDLSHAAAAWKPVEDALFTAGPGTSDKTITARWTGFLDLSGEARGEEPSLVVESIGELNVTPIDGVPGR
jgi:hypothetical protein